MDPLGIAAERRVTQILVGNGYPVLAARDYTGLIGGAPLIQLGQQLHAAMTDLVAIDPKHGAIFLEVKAKRAPGYMRNWELYTHGVDLKSHRDYEAIRTATRQEIYLVVEEAPHAVNDQILTHLIVHLDETRVTGHHAKNWPHPGGRGSRNELGGWCWPRRIMRMLDPTKIAPPASTQLPLL